jgi:hypothetical protein
MLKKSETLQFSENRGREVGGAATPSRHRNADKDTTGKFFW